MFLKKSSSLWIIAGSSLLLLGASYASSMHGWVQQQAPQKAYIPVVSEVSGNSTMLISSTRRLSDKVSSIRPLESSQQKPDVQGLVEPEEREVVQTKASIIEQLEDSSTEIDALTEEAQVENIQPESESDETLSAENAVPINITSQLAITNPLSSRTEEPVQQNVLPTIQAHAYEDEIVVEFPSHLARTTQIKSVLSRIMLSNVALDKMNLLQPSKFNLANKPYYFNQVRDKSNFSIRYPAQAYEYAKVLMNENAYWVQDDAQQFLHIRIPLHSGENDFASLLHGSSSPVASFTASNSEFNQYKIWAQQFAKEYKVPFDLIMAVMEVESAFNPQARSRSNALGLMQIKADAAGRDVFVKLEGINRSPSEKELLNPKDNIRIGTAYLSLLRDTYFNQVKNTKSREMLVISAYNAGLNRVLNLFASTPEEAVEIVNQMSPAQLYQRLRQQHATEEARLYLEKVLRARQSQSFV